MYNNLIYFLIVLLVYTIYQPAQELGGWSWSDLILNLALPAGFWALARHSFRRLALRISNQTVASPGLLYHSLSGRLSVLAIGLFAAAVYLFHLKEILLSWPLAERSAALTGLAGLVYFALFLALLWAEAYQCHALIYRSRMNRGRFALGQLRFNLPIILPYLLISAITDLLLLLPDGRLKVWLNSSLGEAVILLAFMLLLVLLFPLLIRPLWGLVPLPPGEARTTIESFSRRHGFIKRDIMLWPLYEGEGLTAGVMGLIGRWRYLLVTKSLLRILNKEELEAVLGHELGHVRKKHLLFYFFFFIGYLVLAFSLFDLTVLLWPNLFLELFTSSNGLPATTLSLLQGIPVVLLMVLYFRFVLGFFMRNFERQADLFSFRLTGTIRGLVSSLEKIAYFSGQSRDLPSWHHFSVGQRIDYLYQCQSEPALIRRQDRKIRIMLGGYFLVLALLAFSGYQIKTSPHTRQAYMNFTINILEIETARNPDHLPALRFLGDLYYDAGRYEQAQRTYEAVVALEPDDPENLNNLAWTLVIQENPTERDKKRALALAGRAVELKPAAHILDTLAEAQYVNQQPELALRTIERALAAAGPLDDEKYLLEQKAKFEAARPSLDR